jgi:hypothetical protein
VIVELSQAERRSNQLEAKISRSGRRSYKILLLALTQLLARLRFLLPGFARSCHSSCDPRRAHTVTRAAAHGMLCEFNAS